MVQTKRFTCSVGLSSDKEGRGGRKKRRAFMRVIKHPVSARSKKLTLSEFFFFFFFTQNRKPSTEAPFLFPLQTLFAPVFVPFFFSLNRSDAQFFDPEKIVPLRVARILEEKNEGTVHTVLRRVSSKLYFSLSKTVTFSENN